MTTTKQTELLIDRKLLERLQERLDPHLDARDWGMVCDAFRAQSAPEPVQGEAVEYQQLSRYGNWDRIDKAAFDIGKLGQATERFRALYTAAAKPDAELVNILKRVVDYYAEGDGDLKCIAQACRAKLAELAGGENDPAPS